jgi:hypothetical protein
MSAEIWPWGAILLLGVWHGVNPGMGWLFAVALGMQERRSGAVIRALLPLAAGHALAIAAAVLVALAIGAAIPASLLRWLVAVLLVGLGISRLIRHRHPRWGGMRVTPVQLTIWSLLMASAHGAGLMVLPFVFRAAGPHAGHADAHAQHLAMAGFTGEAWTGVFATAVHTAGYLAVTAGIALLVYRRLGLRMLRTMWINLDLIWGVVLVLTGAVTPLL